MGAVGEVGANGSRLQRWRIGGVGDVGTRKGKVTLIPTGGDVVRVSRRESQLTAVRNGHAKLGLCVALQCSLPPVLKGCNAGV